LENIFFIAGPCLAESREMLHEVASELKAISLDANIKVIFKASYRKANRTSVNSIEGFGDIKALEWLAEIKEKYDMPILTDGRFWRHQSTRMVSRNQRKI